MSSFNSLLTYKGETLSIAEWARRTGLKDKTIYMRIREKWTVEMALERPVRRCMTPREPDKRHGNKAWRERSEELRQIREWLRTQPAEVEERREEGDIL